MVPVFSLIKTQRYRTLTENGIAGITLVSLLTLSFSNCSTGVFPGRYFILVAPSESYSLVPEPITPLPPSVVRQGVLSLAAAHSALVSTCTTEPPAWRRGACTLCLWLDVALDFLAPVALSD